MSTTPAGAVRAVAAAQQMPLGKAGPFLAANGVPVFPCVPGRKVPLVKHGLSEATIDGRVAERWWWRWPEANIGVPTGAVSGFDVVDVDVRDTGSGYGVFHQAVDRLGLDGWLMRVLTPSGGMHFYYPADPARKQGNWVSSRHVDFRGGGGAIILPPSQGVCGHDVTQPYILVETRDEGRPVDADALRQMLEPAWARRRLARRLDRLGDSGRRSGAHDAALARWLAARPEGERNAALFWAGCRLVEAGRSFDATLGVLGQAGLDAGLLEREIVATLRSAFRHASPVTGKAAIPGGPTVPAGLAGVGPRPFEAER